MAWANASLPFFVLIIDGAWSNRREAPNSTFTALLHPLYKKDSVPGGKKEGSSKNAEFVGAVMALENIVAAVEPTTTSTGTNTVEEPERGGETEDGAATLCVSTSPGGVETTALEGGTGECVSTADTRETDEERLERERLQAKALSLKKKREALRKLQFAVLDGDTRLSKFITDNFPWVTILRDPGHVNRSLDKVLIKTVFGGSKEYATFSKRIQRQTMGLLKQIGSVVCERTQVLASKATCTVENMKRCNKEIYDEYCLALDDLPSHYSRPVCKIETGCKVCFHTGLSLDPTLQFLPRPPQPA